MRNRGILLAVVVAILVASVVAAEPPKIQPPVQPPMAKKVLPTATPVKPKIDFSKFRLTKLPAPHPQFLLSQAAANLTPPQSPNKKSIPCGIFVWPPPGPSNPNATSRRLYFVNDTGQPLPVGTRFEYQVEGVPASCCHGFLPPNNFSLPPNPPSTWYAFTGDQLPTPQPWTRPCNGWAYLP